MNSKRSNYDAENFNLHQGESNSNGPNLDITRVQYV